MLSLIALPNPVSVSVWFSFQVFAWGAPSLCLAGSYHTSERLGKMSTRWQMGKQPQNSWRMVHRASSGASKGLIRCWHQWCTSHFAYLSKTNQQTLSSFPTALPTIHCQGGRSLHHPLPTICNHCPPRYFTKVTFTASICLDDLEFAGRFHQHCQADGGYQPLAGLSNHASSVLVTTSISGGCVNVSMHPSHWQCLYGIEWKIPGHWKQH